VQPIAAEPRLYERNGHATTRYERLSDLELVRKATNGDERALDVLVTRYTPKVNRLAAQLLGDLEDARDAAQESLVKLCTKLRQFRGEAQFATWLHRLVVNTCRDAAARRRSWEPLAEDTRASADDDPARAAVLRELRAELGAHLAELAPEQARVVVLKHALDYSFEEIAAARNLPVGTAKCYAHRARNRLRERLGDVGAA
jgi:RNA polymerase sigma-70 factor (ECF subfamily)